MLIKILFFFATLGVFNSLIISIYFLFFKRKREVSDFFLGILLLLLSIRVGISCSYYFGTISFPFIKIGLTCNLLLGPTILFRSLMGKIANHKLIRYYLLHCSCILIFIAICWVFFDFDRWDYKIRFTIHSVLTLYLIYTLTRLQKHTHFLKTPKETSSKDRKTIILFLAFIVICLGFVISLKTTYILGSIIYSITFYAVFIYFLLNTYNIPKKETVRKKIDDDQFISIKKKLIHVMETEKIYQNADLNLDKLAKSLGSNRHFLSQVLNENFKKNFYQYINEYRIQEACNLLISKPYSAEAIGYEVGFRSKSAFFSVFKKMKGTTPHKYKIKHSTI